MNVFLIVFQLPHDHVIGQIDIPGFILRHLLKFRSKKRDMIGMILFNQLMVSLFDLLLVAHWVKPQYLTSDFSRHFPIHGLIVGIRILHGIEWMVWLIYIVTWIETMGGESEFFVKVSTNECEKQQDNQNPIDQHKNKFSIHIDPFNKNDQNNDNTNKMMPYN